MTVSEAVTIFSERPDWLVSCYRNSSLSILTKEEAWELMLYFNALTRMLDQASKVGVATGHLPIPDSLTYKIRRFQET